MIIVFVWFVDGANEESKTKTRVDTYSGWGGGGHGGNPGGDDESGGVPGEGEVWEVDTTKEVREDEKKEDGDKDNTKEQSKRLGSRLGNMHEN